MRCALLHAARCVVLWSSRDAPPSPLDHPALQVGSATCSLPAGPNAKRRRCAEKLPCACTSTPPRSCKGNCRDFPAIDPVIRVQNGNETKGARLPRFPASPSSSPLRCCGPGNRRSKQTPCFAWLRPHLRTGKTQIGERVGHVAVAVVFDPRLKGFLTRASRAMRFETRRYCGSYPAGSLLWF